MDTAPGTETALVTDLPVLTQEDVEAVLEAVPSAQIKQKKARKNNKKAVIGSPPPKKAKKPRKAKVPVQEAEERPAEMVLNGTSDPYEGDDDDELAFAESDPGLLAFLEDDNNASSYFTLCEYLGVKDRPLVKTEHASCRVVTTTSGDGDTTAFHGYVIKHGFKEILITKSLLDALNHYYPGSNKKVVAPFKMTQMRDVVLRSTADSQHMDEMRAMVKKKLNQDFFVGMRDQIIVL